MVKFRTIALIEALMIIALVMYIVIPERQPTGLLSQRVYTGLLEPKSYLIMNYETLHGELQSFIEKSRLNASVYVVNMRDGASMGINEEEFYPTLSLSKVPLAILILKQVEEGKLSMNQVIAIPESARDNRSGDMYVSNIRNATIKYLIEKMLKDSDNTAYFTLSGLQDNENYLTLFWQYMGLFPNEDEKKNAFVSPKSMYNIFSSLYLSTLINAEHSEYILSLLTDTNFKIKKYAQLPDDVIVSQKYGYGAEGSSTYFHSCGIMYIQEMRVFYCIMIRDNEQAPQAIGIILNRIYTYSKEAREEWDTYR